MKIENDKPNPLTGQTDALSPTAPTGSSSHAGKTAGTHHKGDDQLKVSAEARLLKAAADAAKNDPGVRRELVEKMRALLAEGKIGTNADQLAESLIDDVLNNH